MPSASPTFGLVGNPNCGKTTLFNALTGARQHVANYPGVTVEKRIGVVRAGERTIELVDLPGAYSLAAHSLDEQVARDFLLHSPPDLLINVVDASNPARNLLLTIQLLELGLPMVVALNMADVAERRGLRIDAAHLAAELGVPVVPIIASRKRGTEQLIQTALRTLVSPSVIRNSSFVIPPAPAPGNNEARLQFVQRLCQQAIRREESTARRWTDYLDHLAIHPIAGWLVMALVFASAYTLTFSIANGQILHWAGVPGSPIDWIGALFGLMGRGVAAVLPAGVLRSLLINGVINGVGGVLVFVPVIFLMFFAISLIDDSGYMARLAFLLDVPLRAFGLQGKSALALAVSGGVAGGCAVPGIMATRTLDDPRERLATILVCPFLNCGAKLPVYAMLIAAFFQRWQGLVMLLLTLLSWSFALAGAYLLRKLVVRGESAPLLLELPPYHLPTLRSALIQAWGRVQLYLRRAGTFILAASILLWVMMSFPRLSPQESAALAGHPAELKQAALAHSLAGRMGMALEPVFAPLGFEWRTNIALIGGTAAKEVIVSTLGTAYSLGEVEADNSSTLSQRLAHDPHWTPLKAFCLILFVMLYAPCVGAIAAIIQETGSWKWGAFSLVYSTAFAWVVCFVTYHGGMWLGL